MYDNYGLVPKPLAAYLPALVDRIKKAAPGSAWVSAVVTALVGPTNIPPQKFVEDLHPQELFSCAGNLAFQAGSPAWDSLIHYVMLNLYSSGFIEKVPQVLEYRAAPELTLEECTQRMLSQDMPLLKREDFKGQKPRWQQFATLLPVVMEKVDYIARQDKHIAGLLRLKVGDIAHRLALGREIADSERSLFLMIAPGGPRAYLPAEWKSAKRERPRVAPCNDNLVTEAFNKLVACTQSGPASRFRKLITVKDGRALTFYWGPGPIDLEVFSGYSEEKGPFVSYELSPALRFPWTEASQMEAVQERQSFVVSDDDNPLCLPPPVQSATSGGASPLTSLDEREFRLFYTATEEQQFVSMFEVDYYHRLTDRLTSSALMPSAGVFPGAQALLYDKGFFGEKFGEGTGLKNSLADYPLIDPILTTGVYSGKVTDGMPPESGSPGTLQSGPWEEAIVWADLKSRQLRMAPQLDVSQLYYRAGGFTVVPGARDHLLIPRSWLFEPRPSDEEWIMGRLGLNPGQRKVAATSVCVSHNMALLGRFFPPHSLPTLNPVAVAASVL